MKILILLNYYYPYVSGVSEYARVLAEELAGKGNQVTVLTSNHAHLKKREVIHGVEVFRAPIIGRISKGTISPSFIFQAIRLSGKADIVNMHLPMIESGIISPWIAKRKLITTYHCDIHLPTSFFNSFIVKCMDISNEICLKRSRYIAVQTIDYAHHSRIAYKYQEKFVETSTPVKDYKRKDAGKENKRIIGFCGRLVKEKGLDILMKAFEILQREEEGLELRIAGDYKNVAGGSVILELKEYLEAHQLQNVSFLGKIPENQMEQFYSSLDVFVLPSVNSLEAFGMVQIEAMYCGTPVVATDLYGVRTIVQKTGMGVVVKSRDPKALAEGIRKVLQNSKHYYRTKQEIQQYFGTEKCVSMYEQTIKKCVREK